MERGKPIPSINISDHTGKVHPLKDYNQKTHIAVVCDPQAKPAELQAHATAAEVMGKTWTWLNVKVLVTDGGPHGLERGVYAIDRYSRLIETFPIKNDFWALLEKEFLYYEARHC